MEKLKLHTPDFTKENIARVAELFPNCVTEAVDEDGTVRRAIDFDQLRQELSGSVVDGPRERYHLDWPGKREAWLAANAPTAKTLRPCRDESEGFESTKNLFIEGDNLDALKLLQETYLNKIKLIYIDPPYNTGRDFIYEDDFAQDASSYMSKSLQKSDEGERLIANTESNGRFHSDWLSMLYPRLKLARHLLRADGAIFISIDDNEEANLRKICGEVFGEENFVASFIWEKRTTRENRKVFSFNHDFVLCFAKNKAEFEGVRNLLPLTDEAKQRYSNPDNDPRGVWQSVSVNAQAGPGRRKEQFYSVTTPGGRVVDPPAGRCWIFTKDRMDELIADKRIWFGADGNNVPRQKAFFSEASNGLTPHTLWTSSEVGTTDTAKKDLTTLFGGVTVFDTPKPVGLLARIVQITMNPGDIALDFFAGSAPLAEAVIRHAEQSGTACRYILVQLPEPINESLPQCEQIQALGLFTIADISKERIRRVGKRISKESPVTAATIDAGFRVLKVDTSNMKDVYYTPDGVRQLDLPGQIDNIKEDRTSEDLLFQVLLDWGVDLSLPIAEEKIEGKAVYFVDEDALAACFDPDINETLVKKLAARKPLRVVFRDSGYGNDSVKINVEQIFKLISPSTDVKSI
jgi:adenine-specific DNA-methyltransferase